MEEKKKVYEAVPPDRDVLRFWPLILHPGELTNRNPNQAQTKGGEALMQGIRAGQMPGGLDEPCPGFMFGLPLGRPSCDYPRMK